MSFIGDCCVCLGEHLRLASGPCGHGACFGCWFKLFELYASRSERQAKLTGNEIHRWLKCPVCRQGVSCIFIDAEYYDPTSRPIVQVLGIVPPSREKPSERRRWLVRYASGDLDIIQYTRVEHLLGPDTLYSVTGNDPHREESSPEIASPIGAEEPLFPEEEEQYNSEELSIIMELIVIDSVYKK